MEGASFVLEIVHYPHPALRYASRTVTQIDDDLRATVRSMFELMYAARGIGLAANQVALPFRFFILNLTADPEQRDQEQVFINPEIVKRHSAVEDEEGCLSLPGVYAKVRRAKTIRIRAYDLEGSLIEHSVDDLFSRAFQHEADHLQGKLFIDYLQPSDLKLHEEQLRRIRSRVSRGTAGRCHPPGRGPGAPARRDDASDPRCSGRAERCARLTDIRIHLLTGGRTFMAPPIRLVFLGTGDFALPSFEHLVETRHHVAALVTQPDRPQGRKQELIPSRIKRAAESHGVRVEQPEDVNAAGSLDGIRAMQPDLLVTAAYGQILSADLLSIPTLGGINLHGSVLPSYRGAAPVARTIQNGELTTGVTVIRMTPRIDAGGIIDIAETPIGPDETAGELEERLAWLGAPLVARAIAALAAGEIPILPQDRTKVTRAPKLRKEDGLIDWSRPALAVHNLVRAMQPWPVASTTLYPRNSHTRGPARIIVHRTEIVDGHDPSGEVVEAEGDRLVVAAGEGSIRILVLQVPGKRPFTAAEFLHGHRIEVGDLMGPPPSTVQA